MDENSDVPEWGIVELMGHRRLAGRLSESTIAGAVMLRIDAPTPDDPTAFTTQFYGGSSIYCLTPTDEETARYVAQREQPEPVAHWELAAKARDLVAAQEKRRQLDAGDEPGDEPDDDLDGPDHQ